MTYNSIQSFAKISVFQPFVNKDLETNNLNRFPCASKLKIDKRIPILIVQFWWILFNDRLFKMSDRLHSVFFHCVLFTEFLEPNISRVFKQLWTIGLNDFKYAKEEALASKKVGTIFLPHFYVWMITRRFGGKERWYLKSRPIRRRNFLTCCKGL